MASKGPTLPYYVFYGDEDFFLDMGSEMARRWPERSVLQFDVSSKLSELALVQELESRSTEGEPRTIIVEDAQKLKESKKKYLRAYVDSSDRKDLAVVLVALVRSEKISDLWSYVGSKGKLSEHKKFKPWVKSSGKTEYHEWAAKKARDVGLAIEEDALDLVVRMSGSNLYRIQNELRKLYLLKGDSGGKLSKIQALSVVAITPTSEPKEVIDNTFAKNVKGAMDSLSVLYNTMGDEASIPVVYGLMRETRKLITARHMLDKGSSNEDIAIALSMNPHWCTRGFLPIVRKHTVPSLIKYMKQLCKLDQDVKGPSRSKRTLVELTVLAIAG